MFTYVDKKGKSFLENVKNDGPGRQSKTVLRNDLVIRRIGVDINNNMLDDVKVILAEYRMALKKNNRYKESLD